MNQKIVLITYVENNPKSPDYKTKQIKNMIDDLGKENGRHIEEKKQLQGRVTDLESKLLDVIGGKQKREG